MPLPCDIAFFELVRRRQCCCMHRYTAAASMRVVLAAVAGSPQNTEEDRQTRERGKIRAGREPGDGGEVGG